MSNRKNLPVVDLEGEIWKDIEGFVGLYAVSNKERVKSIKRKSINNTLTINEKLLRFGRHKNGYRKYTLCKDGKFAFVHLHRLIAAAFIPNPNNLPCINHIDNNSDNNSIDNLEWCSFSHNTRHAYKTGRLTKLGENNSMSKLTELEVLKIFKSTLDRNTLAKEFKVSWQAISDIKNGRRWCSITGKRHMSVKKRICE